MPQRKSAASSANGERSPFFKLHMGRNRLAPHAVGAIDQIIAARIQMGVVNLIWITDEDDFRAFRNPGNNRFHLVRR